MDMQAIKEEVQLKLTGDVVSMELPDSALTKIINSSLREMQRYIDTVMVVTVPYQKCIDMSSYKPSSVVNVFRAKGYMNGEEQGSATVMDPMYATQWMLLSGTGNIANLTDYAYNYSAWNTLLQIRNTTSTDLSHYFDKTTNKLYVNVSTNIPTDITVMYIPRFDDVSQITSDYWIDVLVRLAAAQTKIAVGRVRSKFKQSNALWVLDGDSLIEEGNAELTALRTELKDSTQLTYGID